MLNYFFIVAIIVFLILLLFILYKKNKIVESFRVSTGSRRTHGSSYKSCSQTTNATTCRSKSNCKWNTSTRKCSNK
jgi:hypothetical protein